jgi:hypothetical protein
MIFAESISFPEQTHLKNRYLRSAYDNSGMKEASLVKFYLAKYVLLFFGLLQWSIGGVILLRQGQVPKNQFTAFLFFTMGLIFLSLFLLIAGKIKRVAIGKNKIAIIERHKTHRYEWPEIKSIRLVPYLNLYRMKIRGKKNRIYFLPAGHTEILYGLFPTGEIELKTGK